MKKTFEVEWNDEMGEEWMNIDNLKLCLFGKEHTKPELLTVVEIKEDTTKGVER